MISHIKDANSDRIIVFVHGLGGGKTTWSRFITYMGNNWSLDFGFLFKYFVYYRQFFDRDSIVLKKGRFSSTLIWLVYPLFNVPWNVLKIFWSKRNDHNVALLDSYIRSNCEGSNNIILIAHSMGGLIARRYLVNCKKNQIDIRRFKSLITYATPHKGSFVASGMSIVATCLGIRPLYNFYRRRFKNIDFRFSPQLGDLVFINEFITGLNSDWSKYNLSKDVIFMRMVAKKDWLVGRNSAQHDSEQMDLVFSFDYGHIGIINPKRESGFKPIDTLIDHLSKIDYQDDYFEELDQEIDYDDPDGSEDIDSY